MYIISRSTNPNKKYQVITPTGKKIHFGAKGYGDYIQYNKISKEKAEIKKSSYIARHKVNENFNNKNSAGFWSRWILWNKPTLLGSIRNTASRFGINIKFR